MGAGDAGPACWALELALAHQVQEGTTFLSCIFTPYFFPMGRVQGAEDEIQEQGVQRRILKVYPQTGLSSRVPPASTLLWVSSHLGLKDTL